MKLETDRLVLEPFTLDDCDFIIRLLNSPAFIQNIEDQGIRTRDQAAAYLAEGPMASYRAHGHGHGLLRVARKSDRQPIGLCGLIRRQPLQEVDLAYAFLPEGCGQGYALEAAAAVLASGRRTLGLVRVGAIVAPGNLRSISLLTKLGFRFAKELPFPDGSGTVALYEFNDASDRPLA